MPCYHPMQAFFTVRKDGKKNIFFSSGLANLFAKGALLPKDSMSLPCGNCIGCRLEKSRQWAVRCVHEASLYEENCFITLTYNDENLPIDGSLSKREFKLFMKKLRRKYGSGVRYYHCGEYGERFRRPHYHACLFNFDFSDKKLWKVVNGFRLFISPSLTKLWGKGFCIIGTVTFESAAYVARYCTKKVNGKRAHEHYQGLQSEYSTMSLKPGIAHGWYDKWRKDVFPSDWLVVNGVKCKPPRYYDRQLEKEDPLLLAKIKELRAESAQDKAVDNMYHRLLVREKCQQARFKKLIRVIEEASYDNQSFCDI